VQAPPERSEIVDPNYATFAEDINKVISDRYECFDVSPVRFRPDEDGNITPEKVSNAQIADHIAYFVRIKDEYREPWWREFGGDPFVCVPMSIEHFESCAGVDDMARVLVEESFENLFLKYKPGYKKQVPKQKVGARKKSKSTVESNG
jgi:hypothetical protein